MTSYSPVAAPHRWTRSVVLASGLAFAAATAAACSPASPSEGSSPGTANPATLKAAIADARPGATISLAPGNYETVSIVDRTFPGGLTIVSADPDDPARVPRMMLRGVRNLTLRSLDLGSALKPGEPTHQQLSSISNSTNVTFEDVDVHGSLDGDPANDGIGLFIIDSDSIAIRGSSFQQLYRGAVFLNSNDIDFVGNRLHDMRSDGVTFAGVTGVLIDGNRFTNFYPVSNDHPDAIQFWTAGQAKPSSDIEIINNEILQGKGRGLQGIFFGDEAGIPYQNIRIRNNLLYVSDLWHGISIRNGDGVEIVSNSTLSLPQDDKVFWIYVRDSRNTIIAGNVTDRLVVQGGHEIAVRRNIDLRDSPEFLDQLEDIGVGPGARLPGLVMDAGGYSPPADASLIDDNKIP